MAGSGQLALAGRPRAVDSPLAESRRASLSVKDREPGELGSIPGVRKIPVAQLSSGYVAAVL